jgi:hypothetical protein
MSHDEIAEVSLYAADLAVGEHILAALLRGHCPAYLDETAPGIPAPYRVAVPLEFAPQAGQLLLADQDRLEVAGIAGRRLVYRFRPSGSQPVAPPARVEALLDQLEQWAAEIPGEPTVKALMALQRLEGLPLPASYRRRLGEATDPLVRRDLCRVAAIVGDPGVADLLQQAREDPDERVRIEAIDALAAIASATGGAAP